MQASQPLWVLRQQAHFEDHPQDLAALRHDKALLVHRVKPHLKHVPAYLLPNAGGPTASTAIVDGLKLKDTHVPFRVRNNRAHRAGKARGCVDKEGQVAAAECSGR